MCKVGGDTKDTGGCGFDHPVGVCGFDELKEGVRGCSHTLGLWIQSQMDAVGITLQLMSLIPLVAGIFSCCMCFKRKHEDVLPTKYVQEGGT